MNLELAIGEIPTEVNPCVRRFGHGPPAVKCKHCEFLLRRGRYFKCYWRGVTCGPATDHRANWNACAYYHEAK